MIRKEIVQILFIKGSFFRDSIHFLKNNFSFTNEFLNINFPIYLTNFFLIFKNATPNSNNRMGRPIYWLPCWGKKT